MEEAGDGRSSRESVRSGERKGSREERRRLKDTVNVCSEENSQLMNSAVGTELTEQNNSADNLEAEIAAEDPYATSIIFVCTDVQEVQRESEKNLSSPDSNDSGIQADSTQNFHHLSNDLDDLYGVVKKPKRKPVSHTMEGRCPADSLSPDANAPSSTVLEKVATQRESVTDHYATVEVDSGEEDVDDAVRNKTKGMRITEEHRQNLGNGPVVKQKQSLDAPYAYAEVEEDSGDDDPAYAVVRNKARGIRLVESDDSYSCDDNGNHHNDNDHLDNNDDCTKTEAFLLPEGWQRHEDEFGSYYWHIKSGITQREPPSLTSPPVPAVRKSRTEIRHLAKDLKIPTKSKDTIKHPVDVEFETRKQNHFTSGFATSSSSSSNRFLIHCQGSVQVADEDLAEGRSSLTINQCISSLTRRPSIMQPGKLQGLDLYLEFIGDQLVLTDVRTGSTVRSESVKSVRVWGVGREKDSQDFAYVSFDPVLERHICWVFSCEKTGHEVASALRSTCYKILKENEAFAARMAPALTSSQNPGAGRLVYESQVSRESNRSHLRNWNEGVVFPVPMNETKKIISCHYLGMMKVPKPTGMDVLNDAMEMIYAGVPSSKWVSVSVEVAPSAVTVYDRGNTTSVIFECRIRFLTFLGICINNCKLGAFIMHSAQNEFFAHVFHCIPDAGLFCRTIKAACKLRYQKCLDAQAQQQDRGKISHQTLAKNPMPFQGLRESFQKKVTGVSNLLAGNNKKQQQKG